MCILCKIFTLENQETLVWFILSRNRLRLRRGRIRRTAVFPKVLPAHRRCKRQVVSSYGSIKRACRQRMVQSTDNSWLVSPPFDFRGCQNNGRCSLSSLLTRTLDSKRRGTESHEIFFS